MWNVGSVLCDIIIAVSMTYYVGFRNLSLLALESNKISYLAHNSSFRDMIVPSSRPK